MLYNGEYTNFIKCKTFQYVWYKPNNDRENTFIAYKKLRYFSIIFMLQRLFMF
jgi:hypothetical protein